MDLTMGGASRSPVRIVECADEFGYDNARVPASQVTVGGVGPSSNLRWRVESRCQPCGSRRECGEYRWQRQQPDHTYLRRRYILTRSIYISLFGSN